MANKNLVFSVRQQAYLDSLVSKATAFRSWQALIAACELDGYVPTLRTSGVGSHDSCQLAAELNAAGYAAWCPIMGDRAPIHAK